MNYYPSTTPPLPVSLKDITEMYYKGQQYGNTLDAKILTDAAEYICAADNLGDRVRMAHSFTTGVHQHIRDNYNREIFRKAFADEVERIQKENE